MPNTEQLIVACAACDTRYNVTNMAPGAKFKCQKCGAINIVPALEPPVEEIIEEPIEEIIEEPAPPPPPPKPQARPQAKAGARPPTTKIKTAGSRVPSGKPSATMKRGRGAAKAPEGDEETEAAEEKTGILAPQHRKKLYLAGAGLLVVIGIIYGIHSKSVAAENKKITEQASAVIKEINKFVADKDFAKALEKSQEFVKEYKDCDIPMVKKNVKATEASIKAMEQRAEQEKVSKAKLEEMISKVSKATPDQYAGLEKEFNSFIDQHIEEAVLADKARGGLKDLQAKMAVQQEETDNKAYTELLATEIKNLTDEGNYDEAVKRVNKFIKDNPKLSKSTLSEARKKITELKSMK